MPVTRPVVIAAFLLFAPLLHAQPSLNFGDPFPLGDTKYGSAVAAPVVASNGRDFFLFWQAGSNIRVTKVVDGEHRAGRHVIAGDGGLKVTWTGTHFLLLTTTADGVFGQLLDANAEPVGGTLTIARNPAPFVHQVTIEGVASNGETVLVLYRTQKGVSAAVSVVALTPAGVPTGAGSTLLEGEDAGEAAVASNGNGFAAVLSTHPAVVAVAFDSAGRERSRASIARFGQTPVMIASNGRDYLAAWQVSAGAQAAHIAADGSTGAVVTLGPANAGHRTPAVAWTGANWAVAHANESVHVAYVHPTMPRVVGQEDAGAGSHPSLGVANGRVMMTWVPGPFWGEAPAVGSLLPLAGREPGPVTFGAASQELAALKSTADATLAVWNESVNGVTRLRAGVRAANGDWAEREILGNASGALVGTDGRDFVVVAGDLALFLDATSRMTAGPVRLPFGPRTIAWTGTDYLIANDFSVARLSRSGTVSAPVRVQGHFRYMALASNGSKVMALMFEPEDCQILCISFFGKPRAVELGADLRPIGVPRLIGAGDEYITVGARLLWDGRRFVAAWGGQNKVHVAQVIPGGGEPTILAEFPSHAIDQRVHLTAVEGGVALTWRELTDGHRRTRTWVAAAGHDGRSRTEVLDDGGRWADSAPFVAALPNGGIGLLSSTPQFAPPYHGSSRIVMRVAGAAIPSKPEAPRLTGIVRNGRVELAWTRPLQDVAGYRIEYRIGEGSWNELDRWLDANDDELTVLWQLRSGVPYQFRIRAFNDAGASDYSAPVLLNVARRRAVR